jgi:CheY-like chemotaxis protein
MPNRKGRVLCVDDNQTDCELIKTYLNFVGIEVVLSDGIANALKLAMDQIFDLCLIDLKFPEGSGADLVRQIRRFDEKTPIVFHSASAYAEDIEGALNAGAQAYITKPSEPDAVIKIISDLIDTPLNSAAAA